MKNRPNEGASLKGIRSQQIDPETQDFYPWWEETSDGKLAFNPSLYNPSRYRSPVKLLDLGGGREVEDPYALENLRIIDPAAVKKAFFDLIKKALKNPDQLLTTLVGTGGTCSMAEDKNTKELKPMVSPEQLMKEAGAFGSQFTTSSFSFPTLIDSSQMKIDYIADMAIAMAWFHKELSGVDLLKGEVTHDNFRIFEELSGIAKRFTGFIVCHGTDTLVQSQTYLSFMLGSYCPFNVFYVAAQTTSKDRLNDVGANFKIALEASKDFHGAEIGVHGVCGGGTAGGVYNGPTSLKYDDRFADFLKDHNSNGKTLSASDFGRSRNVDFYERLAKERNQFHKYPPPMILRGHSRVLNIKPSIGDDPNEVEKMVKNSTAKAVIVETCLSFTIERQIADAIVRGARGEPSKIVFAVNSSPNGSVDHGYADARYLAQQGIIPLKMLPHAAYAKFLWATAFFGDNTHKIIDFMIDNNFRNEQLHQRPDPTSYRKHFMAESSNKHGRFPSRFTDEQRRMMVNLAPHQYLDASCQTRLHLMNDNVLRTIIEGNRDVLRTLLEDVLAQINEEKEVGQWLKNARKKLTPRVRKNEAKKALEEGFKSGGHDEELFMYEDADIDGINMHVEGLVYGLLKDVIKLPDNLIKKSIEQSMPLIEAATTKLQPVSYKETLQGGLEIPAIGQPRILTPEEASESEEDHIKRIRERRKTMEARLNKEEEDNEGAEDTEQEVN